MIASKKNVKSASRRTPAKRPEGLQSVAAKLARPTTIKKKRLEGLDAKLVKLFRAHWRSVSAKLVRGVDVARKRAHMFYATNDRECLRVARRYYAPTRAAKLATASDDKILQLSDPWLSAARHQVLDGWVELRELVAAEYVALVYSEFPPKGPASLVAPLPDESVAYGDVYEITAGGCSTGAILRVCKSVAEPFLKSERREAMAGIEQEFFENARADGDDEDEWRVDGLELDDPRAVDMEISARFPDIMRKLCPDES